ncbi:SRPBCC family protein [Sphingomonas sp.]|uniref:SRPBCC family protein n=1 Tax=Sphingomonas sp. TaxID=28214 RepID=UPI003B3ADDED
MSPPPATHGSFAIERSYSAPVERVFAAFADPRLKKSWFADSATHEITAFESDFRVGGVERLNYRFGPDTPFPGAALTNEGQFHDIVPDRRIVTASRMAIEGKPISVALVTIELAPASQGTDVLCTFQGVFFEGADGAVLREQGMRTLLDRLGDVLAA